MAHNPSAAEAQWAGNGNRVRDQAVVASAKAVVVGAGARSELGSFGAQACLNDVVGSASGVLGHGSGGHDGGGEQEELHFGGLWWARGSVWM